MITIILTLTLLIVRAANAYDNCPLGGGLSPIPNYLACPFGNPHNVKVCDSNCNCYWVTQCQ